jgi:hypothetical protein
MSPKSRPSWALTDSQGRFQVRFDIEKDGAVVGTHIVWVSYEPNDPREAMELAAGKIKLPQDKAAILEKFGRLETSPLKVEIKENGQILKLELD